MNKINCILLIDDNSDDNEFHEIIIQEAGVCNCVRTAENGVKGLEYLAKSVDPAYQQDYPKPDLIFLDINMPRMNGFEFLEAYNKLDDNQKAKAVICMLTTSLNPDDRKKALAMGAVSEFKHKPLTEEILNEIIAKYFSNDAKG